MPDDKISYQRINIGELQDDFLLSGALVCNDDVTRTDWRVALVRCVNPVQGKYLTIEKYSKSGGDYNQLSVLSLCEFKVFGLGLYYGNFFPFHSHSKFYLSTKNIT